MSQTYQRPFENPPEMMRVLKFLAGIKPDKTGLSFALPRTIQKETGEEAEREGLVRTMRTNLSGPDGILSAMITEKGCSNVSVRGEFRSSRS